MKWYETRNRLPMRNENVLVIWGNEGHKQYAIATLVNRGEWLSVPCYKKLFKVDRWKRLPQIKEDKP